MTPQLEAHIDLDAIARNTEILARHANGAAVMAVVKADGYGHGAVEVARTVLSAGARELGVTTIDEALQLRTAGISAPVLSWLNAVDADYAAAIDNDVEIGVSSIRHLDAVVAAARTAGKVATVTVKVDTGLNRNGVSPDELPRLVPALAQAQRAGHVRLRAVFSHLARADEPAHPVIDVQKLRFEAAIDQVRSAGLEPELVHLANSAATLVRPDLHYDLVRPGIAIYGLTPVPEIGDFGLVPAMTYSATVVLVKKVAKGEGVSYGHEWIAPQDTTVALLPVGYADGLPRALGGRFSVMIGDRQFPSIGRVCMDQVVIDLGPDGADVREGDIAVLFGRPGAPTAQDWADLLGTIHYEVVTGVRGRAVRTYVQCEYK